LIRQRGSGLGRRPAFVNLWRNPEIFQRARVYFATFMNAGCAPSHIPLSGRQLSKLVSYFPCYTLPFNHHVNERALSLSARSLWFFDRSFHDCLNHIVVQDPNADSGRFHPRQGQLHGAYLPKVRLISGNTPSALFPTDSPSGVSCLGLRWWYSLSLFLVPLTSESNPSIVTRCNPWPKDLA
jgi:hypothetical protein